MQEIETIWQKATKKITRLFTNITKSWLNVMAF